MNAKVSENEQYLSASNRITAVIVMVIGVAGQVDIAVEWRTLGGLEVAAVIALLMVASYVGLFRPSVTLRPESLLIRNHVRNHVVPWSMITEADVTDILRIHTADRRLRCPGVQLVMRDIRKERAGTRKRKTETSMSRAEFVVGRVDHHIDLYGGKDSADAGIVTTWAVPELAIAAVLAVVVVVAQLLR
ncbi:PH domain-containing protein [Streptomyces sp. SID13031]|uniref:PH domain-containing protein n=1 Tax=Streptomyces sp. SID13031 TaxID=2706046 RepID=UPI0013C9E957|nr:PH domain-containing protein [Streptomyces sp. SID13031]NEA31471.1 PH domain-containing protein [Streptomyces sp. SID13031]